MATGAERPQDGAGGGSSPDRDGPAEGTFADVFDSFTLDRSWRRRRRKKAGGDSQQQPAESSVPEPSPLPDRSILDAEQPPVEESAAIVRPYTWTRGRTRSEFALELETLVSRTTRAGLNPGQLSEEHQAVVRVCDQPRSVAEVAALLSIPLGVVQVLLGDMATLDLIRIHETATPGSDMPNLALMGRVLSGLRNL